MLVVDAGPLSPEFPAWTNFIYMCVDDVDAAFERALARGAKVVMPVADQEYQERSGGVKDMADNTWWISTYFGA